MPTVLDNGQRSPRKLLRAAVARLLGREPMRTVPAGRSTYTIQDGGPYDEAGAREKIRGYCDEHGLHAALTLTVIETRADGTTGGRVDPGRFLDGR